MGSKFVTMAIIPLLALAGCAAAPPNDFRQAASAPLPTPLPAQEPEPERGNSSTYVDILAEMRANGCEFRAFELSENIRQMDLKIGCK